MRRRARARLGLASAVTAAITFVTAGVANSAAYPPVTTAAGRGGPQLGWPVAGQNVHNTRFAADEHRIGEATVSRLAPR